MELEEAAEGLVSKLAAGATKTMGRIKHLCDSAARNDLDTRLELEAAASLACARSNDAREGVQAFIDKREPRLALNRRTIRTSTA